MKFLVDVEKIKFRTENMNSILKHFLKLKILLPPNCDKTLEQYTQFLEEAKRMNSHELRFCKTWGTNLDEFTPKSWM